jgi:ketosteroid isomerase-like protein
MTPNWINIAVLILGAIGFGSWIGPLLLEWIKRRFPSRADEIDFTVKQSNSAQIMKNAQILELQIHDKLKVMVDEETKKMRAEVEQLRTMLVEQAQEMRNRLQHFIKLAADEKTRAEDYWDQLQDAKRESAVWQDMYENLKAKYEPEPKNKKQ